jgi:subtilisin family serine protease
MRGRVGGDIGKVGGRLAPFLDVLVNGSTEVNGGRAEQSGSVALRVPARTRARRPRPARPPAAAADLKLLSPREVASLRRALPAGAPAPAVDFSVFVHLSDELDPARRAQTVRRVEQLSRRTNWKRDTAAVEISGENVLELSGVAGVYVEPGQRLRAPEPLFLGDSGRPAAADRRISAQARRHGYGHRVLVGVVDVGGFDFAHPDFLDAARRTRWCAIWDQGGTVRPSPTASRRGDRRFGAFDYGAEILREHMDAAIAAAPRWQMTATALEPQSAMTPESHGTHVASIAAGNSGVAREALLAGVLVALRPEDLDSASSFYDSTRIADAVEYLLALAADLGGDGAPLPVSINISLGTNGHAHDTSSAMARWIDNALATPGRCVTVAAGNAGQVEPASPADSSVLVGRIHAGGSLAATGLSVELGWMVGRPGIGDVSDNELEIWYASQDRVDVEVKPPDGPWVGPIHPGELIRNEVLANGTVLSVYSETYHPANGANRISIVLSPFYGPPEEGVVRRGPIAGGEWRVRLTGTVIRDGRYDAWIERDDPRPGDGGGAWRLPSLFSPGTYTDDRMISSLGCAERIISVANIDVVRNMPHATSSRGPTRDGRLKPDLGADGTAVVAACGFDANRRWIAMTGTSMASPNVCGVAALMLAIAPGLTSAQILGIMRTTSRPLPGHDFAWRNDTGFGVIDGTACVREAARFAPPRAVDAVTP